MTTYFAFQPTAQQVFSFQPTLDGATYNVAVLWNFAAQRWYLRIQDLSGNLIVYRPLIGSPPTTLLSNLSWTNGVVTATAPGRMGYRLGQGVTLTISGASPDALNGVFPCTVTSPTTFTYPLGSDPGQILATGSWSSDINLVAGFFTTSTLVFRASTQQFEVKP